MKREDQKRNKELQNNLNILLKECPKRYKQQKIKKKDYILWTVKNNMIYSFFPTAGINENDLKPFMRVRIEFKPVWVDDLLWDILGMESNKNEPESLRVVGVFTARTVIYSDYSIELQSEEIECLRAKLFEKIDEFFSTLEDLDENKYINEMLNSNADACDKILVAIHLNDNDRVREIINSSNSEGRFIIGDKTFRELIIEYLQKQS